MEEALELVVNNQSVKDEAKNDVKEFHKKSVETKIKIGENYTAIFPAVKEAFRLMREENKKLKKTLKSNENKNSYINDRMKQRKKLIKELEQNQ